MSSSSFPLSPELVERVARMVGLSSYGYRLADVFDFMYHSRLLDGFDPKFPRNHIAYILRQAKTTDGGLLFTRSSDDIFYVRQLRHPSRSKVGLQHVMDGFLEDMP